MKCGDKEWQHCRVEKMGCKGCYYDEIESIEYYTVEEIKKWKHDHLIKKFMDLQELNKMQELLICNLKNQKEIDETITKTSKNLIEEILQENNRLLELCMFALLPKKIYNHELSNSTKEAFKNIITQNINEDTHTIRNEIVRYWNGK